MDKEKQIFTVDDFWDIEKLLIHNGPYRGPDTLVRPVLKLVKGIWGGKDEITLQTAYFSPDNTLTLCPVRFFYLQFSELRLIPENHRFKIECSITLFSKDLRDSKTFTYIESRVECYQTILVFSKFLKYCNGYVDRGHQIGIFNFTERPVICSPSSVLYTVQQLKFKFFEQGQSRPGRDDYEHTSCEIFNLPTDPFLFDLLKIGILHKYHNADISEERVRIHLHSSAIGGMADTRKKEVLLDWQEKDIREMLIVFMIRNFNEEKEHWSRYTRTANKQVEKPAQ